MSDMEAGDGRGEPRPTTSGSGSSPKEMAASAAQTVKQEAASFAGDAREKATEKFDAQKEVATRTLGDFANAIRKAGDELDQSDQSMATRLVRQAADGLEGFARSVSDKRPEELLDAVRDFGRRNPTAFIAGSVLAGIALGRFLKSSSESAQSTSSIQDRAPATFSAGDVGGVSALGVEPGVYDPMLDPAGFADADAAELADPTAAGATSIGTPEGSDDLEGGRGGDIDRSRYGAGS